MGVVCRDSGQNLFHSAKPPGTAVGLTTLEVSVPEPVGPTKSSSGPPLCPLGGCGLTQHSLGVSQPWALARHPKLEHPPSVQKEAAPLQIPAWGLSLQSPRWSLSHPQGRVLPQTRPGAGVCSALGTRCAGALLPSDALRSLACPRVGCRAVGQVGPAGRSLCAAPRPRAPEAPASSVPLAVT